MDGRLQAVGFVLVAVLAITPASSLAADQNTPLRLKFSSATQTAPTRILRNARRPARFQQAIPSLSQRALQSLLQDADGDAALAATSNNAQFRFKRPSNAGRDLAAGYESACDSVSQKVWNEPDGKRVRFDVAGKPGLAVEIPLR